MALERTDSDVVDLAEIWGALRRNTRWIVAGGVLGLVAALAVSLLLPARYEATSKIILRGQEGLGASALSRLGGLADLIPGTPASGFDTELEILTSRTVVGEVVDSLGLQAAVVKPAERRPSDVFSAFRFPADLLEGKYRFEREGDRFAVAGPAGRVSAVPGTPSRVGGAMLTLRTGGLPDAFTVVLFDREDAVDLVLKELQTDKLDGDVARLTFSAADRRIAASVPNALVAEYLSRRKTTDRGVNQHRYEFLLAHTDSIQSQLASAEEALRRYQEQSRVMDPAVQGKAELERAMTLKANADDADVEIRTLEKILAGNLAPRDLAAYPTFLRNAAINDVLSRLLEAESRRTGLLERRTEADPEVITLNTQIRGLETQLVSTARAYLGSLTRQRGEIQQEMGKYASVLAALPEQSKETLRLTREVRRLSETQLALQSQLVQARLGTIGEGGDVQQIDAAVAPKKAAFPKIPLNLAIGLLGGLFLGVVGAFGNAYLGQSVREPRDAELATGLPATRFRIGAPFLLGGTEGMRSLLVIPAGNGASSGAVARKIAATAALQGRSVALVDLESLAGAAAPHGGSNGNGNGTGDHTVPGDAPRALLPAPGAHAYPVYHTNREAPDHGGVRPAVAELERDCSLVVTALPALEHDATAALLSGARSVVVVAREGRVTRAELQDVVGTLRRVGIDVTGVILQREEGNGGRRA